MKRIAVGLVKHPVWLWTALFLGMPCALTAAVFLLTALLALPVYLAFEVI